MEEHSSVALWLSSNLVVIKIGWHLDPQCEHVTLGLLKLLITQEVATADRGGEAFTLSAALQDGAIIANLWKRHPSSTLLPLLSFRETVSITLPRYHLSESSGSDLRGHLLILVHLYDSSAIKGQ